VRAEVREGAAEAPRMSNTAYAALVSAEINSHKHYPLSARQNNMSGSVCVVFAISPSSAAARRTLPRKRHHFFDLSR